MKYEQKVVDRQVGRNADLFAAKIGEMPTPDERYAYIRILISIIEQAHPEWNQAPNKDMQIAHLIFHMSHGAVPQDEISEIVRLRDEERGFTNHLKDRDKDQEEASDKDADKDQEEASDKEADEDQEEASDKEADKDQEKASDEEADKDQEKDADEDGDEDEDQENDGEKDKKKGKA
jgi:cobalamin biosynthesis protein CobT